MINGKYFCAVILGAGKSTRMGFDKVTAMLCGKPVFMYSVEAFIKSGADEIILAVSEENLDTVKSALSEIKTDIKLSAIIGGCDRVQSAVKALDYADMNSGIIAIHDCARPLVTEATIRKTAENAIEYGASIPAVPVKDTIKICEDKFINSTPDRSILYMAQTPQIFDITLYRKALLSAVSSGKAFTDDASMCEAIGVSVRISEGDYRNIKLTTAEDIFVAERFMDKYN